MKNRGSTQNLINKGLKLSLVNLWRNKFLSIATIFVMGIIIFIFNIVLAVNFIAGDSLRDISKKVDITVYLKESTEVSQIQQILRDLNSLNEVDNAVYNSKSEALDQIKATHPDISDAFDKFDLGNPLPASISITTASPEDHQKIADFLEESNYNQYFSNIIRSKSSGESEINPIISSVSRNLAKLSAFTEQVIFWMIVSFLVGGALIIANALQITIFNRRREISIMKLVGAPLWFIRFPFVIEGIFYGIFSVILGFAMLTVLSQNFAIEINQNWLHIFLIEILTVTLISVISSIIAVHEHLYKKSI